MANPYLTLAVTKDGTTRTATKEITGGGGWSQITDTVPDSTTDREIGCLIDASKLKMIAIYSTADVTLEANDGSSADYTLTIEAGSPLVWFEGCGLDNPIEADTEAFFVTNSSGGSATLEIYIEQDPTPAD